MSEQPTETQEFDRDRVVIERAVPEDAEVICDIRDVARIDAYPNAELGITAEQIRINCVGLNGEFLPRRVEHTRKQLGEAEGIDGTIFVAKIDGKVVGFADPDLDEKGRHFIGMIYVYPEYQGTGIGGKLMKAALDYFGREEDIYLEVVSYNEKSIGFYEHIGFEKTDEKASEEEGRPDFIVSLPQTVMVLRAVAN